MFSWMFIPQTFFEKHPNLFKNYSFVLKLSWYILLEIKIKKYHNER